MANRDLKFNPHRPSKTNPNWWWYEEPQGIAVYHAPGDFMPAERQLIRWSVIRAALERKDK